MTSAQEFIDTALRDTVEIATNDSRDLCTARVRGRVVQIPTDRELREPIANLGQLVHEYSRLHKFDVLERGVPMDVDVCDNQPCTCLAVFKERHDGNVILRGKAQSMPTDSEKEKTEKPTFVMTRLNMSSVFLKSGRLSAIWLNSMSWCSIKVKLYKKKGEEGVGGISEILIKGRPVHVRRRSVENGTTIHKFFLIARHGPGSALLVKNAFVNR
jgi:hypothetical protein